MKYTTRAISTFSKEKIKKDHELLVKLKSLMKSVDYNRGITELEENLGYATRRDNDYIEEQVYHEFTEKNLESLYAICDGNLPLFKRLHKKGHFMGHYKKINILLAFKYGHVEIIYYLVKNNLINSDINCAIGQLASPSTFDKLLYDKHLFGKKISGNKLKENKRKGVYTPSIFDDINNKDAVNSYGATLSEYYTDLSVIDINSIIYNTHQRSYEHRGETFMYGINNSVLRDHINNK
jgi:hypothetical protein